MTGQQLDGLMRELKLSQAALARKLEVDPVTVWRWRNGSTPVPKAVAELLLCWRDHGGER